jgi:hypothetical protein
MESLVISKSAIFHIDNQLQTSEFVESVGAGDGLERSLKGICIQLFKNTSFKTFAFDPEIPLFKENARNIWESSLDESYAAIADHLAQVEGSNPQNRRIPKGSLLLVKGTIDGKRFVYLAKIDRSEFLNDESLEFETGLASERVVFKACLLQAEDVSAAFPTSAKVIDSSNNGFAKYWWGTFLGLVEHRTNQVNSKLAFKSLEKILHKGVSQWKTDFQTLRNALVHHFRAARHFSIAQVVETVIGNYQPQDSGLSEEDKAGFSAALEIVKTKILAAPENERFDSVFEIDSSVISARIINQTIELRTEFELTIKADYSESLIKGKKIDGEKWLLIKTDVGYDNFRKDADE